MHDLKKKGRYGDSEMRKVDGLLSHVSKQEAELIDKFGKEGEAYVKAMGAGTINPKTGLPEYWGLWKDYIEPALESGVEWISDSVTDLTQGFADYTSNIVHQPFGEKIADSWAGTFWDTHIGREGLIGEGLEMLNLGDSGTTADKKNRAKSKLRDLKDESTALFNRQVDSINAGTDAQLFGQNSIAQRRIKQNSMTNMATDNSRMNAIDSIIAGNIRDQNKVISDNISRKLDKESAYNLEQAKYDSEIKAISDS